MTAVLTQPTAASRDEGRTHGRACGSPSARTAPVARPDDAWRGVAVCRHADPTLFFPEPDDHETIAQAVAVCRTCPVIEACLADALAARERHGIRGGLTARQRQKLLAAHRRTVSNYGEGRSGRNTNHQPTDRVTVGGYTAALGVCP